MSDNKKKRLSMLDSLAAAGAPTPASMIVSSRPLRAARNAVDGYNVWDLDPAQIIDTRIADRLSHEDVADLRQSIETTGQTVPILVRRHPTEDDKYLLVYGRRRLEAIRTSDKVKTVRALIATLDDAAATEAQISENMARRDLTYIEKALFAHELIKSGFGNQSRVAEVLTVTKSAISMGIAIVETIGVDLVRAIGPAEGIGRPRWDALTKALETTLLDPAALVEVAERARAIADIDVFSTQDAEQMRDPSVAAFEAVFDTITAKSTVKPVRKPDIAGAPRSLRLDANLFGKISRTKTAVRLDLDQGPFADWFEDQAQVLMQDLHARWERREKKD